MIKTKRNWKRKIPQTAFKRVFLRTGNLKVKLWWGGAWERKKRAFSVSFILSEGNFFKICVLYQCIVYWIHFQNMHTFTYQKTLLDTFFFFSKSSKAFSVSLNWNILKCFLFFSQNKTFTWITILKPTQSKIYWILPNFEILQKVS